MKLTATCSNCFQPVNVPSGFSENRVELAKRYGNQITVDCKACGATSKVHVNKVIAVAGLLVKIGLYLAIVAAIVGVYFLYKNTSNSYWSYILLVIPFVVYQIGVSYDKRGIQIFNMSRMPEQSDSKQPL